MKKLLLFLFLFVGASLNAQFNVKDYGAIGNGTTDDRIAFMNTITAAINAGGGTIILPSGVYAIGSTIDINITDKKIKFEGMGTSVIKGISGSGYSTAFIFSSTASGTDSFTTSPKKGSYEILTSSLYNNVQDGDLLQITSTDKLVNASGYLKGELVKVRRVIGNKILLDKPLYLDYTQSTSVVNNLNAGNIEISGIDFIDFRIEVNNANGLIVNKSSFKDCKYYPLIVYNSKDILIENTVIQRDTSSQYTYAINIASCVDITVNNCKIVNYNQAIVYCGTYPSKSGIISNNVITGSGAQIDTHGGVQDIKILNNTIYDGSIYCKGANCEIIGNRLISSYYAQNIQYYAENLNSQLVSELQTDFCLIKNNTIYSSNKKATGGGIVINFATYSDTLNYVDVSGNYVLCGGYAFLFCSDVSTGNYVRHMTIKDNYFKTSDLTRFYSTMYFSSLITINDLTIEGNTITQENFYTLHLTGGWVNTLKIRNNYFYIKNPNPGNTMVYVRNFTDALVEGNHFVKSGIQALSGANSLTIRNNTFKDINEASPQSQTAIIIQPGVNYSLVQNNLYVNFKGRIWTGWPDKIYRDETRYLSGSLTDNAPTVGQINSITGTGANLCYRGFKAVIKDIDGTGLTYLIESDGLNWNYRVLTKI